MRVIRSIYERLIRDKDPRALAALIQNHDKEMGDEIMKKSFIRDVIILRDVDLTLQLIATATHDFLDDTLNAFFAALLEQYHAYDATLTYRQSIDEKILNRPSLLDRFDKPALKELLYGTNEQSFSRYLDNGLNKVNTRIIIHRLRSLDELNKLDELISARCPEQLDRYHFKIIKVASRWGRVDILSHYAKSYYLGKYLPTAVEAHQIAAVELLLNEFQNDQAKVIILEKSLNCAIGCQYFDIAHRLLTRLPPPLRAHTRFEKSFTLAISQGTPEAMDFAFALRTGFDHVVVLAIDFPKHVLKHIIARLSQARDEHLISQDKWQYEINKGLIASVLKEDQHLTEYLISLGGDITFGIAGTEYEEKDLSTYEEKLNVLEIYVREKNHQTDLAYLTFITELFIDKMKENPDALDLELGYALHYATICHSLPFIKFFLFKGASYHASLNAIVDIISSEGPLEILEFFWGELLQDKNEKSRHEALLNEYLDYALDLNWEACDLAFFFIKKGATPTTHAVERIKKKMNDIKEKPDIFKKFAYLLMSIRVKKLLTSWYGEEFSFTDVSSLLDNPTAAAFFLLNENHLDYLLGDDLSTHEKALIKQTKFVLRAPNGVYAYPHNRGAASERGSVRKKYYTELTFGGLVLLLNLNMIFHRYTAPVGDRFGIWINLQQLVSIEICPSIHSLQDLSQLPSLISRLEQLDYNALSEKALTPILQSSLSKAIQKLRKDFVLKWRHLTATFNLVLFDPGQVVAWHSRYLSCIVNNGNLIITPHQTMTEKQGAIAIHLFYLGYLFKLFSSTERVLQKPAINDKSSPTIDELIAIRDFSFTKKSILDFWLAMRTSYDNVNAFLREVINEDMTTLTGFFPFLQNLSMTLPMHAFSILLTLQDEIDQLISELIVKVSETPVDKMDIDTENPVVSLDDMTTEALMSKAFEDGCFIPVSFIMPSQHKEKSAESIPQGIASKQQLAKRTVETFKQLKAESKLSAAITNKDGAHPDLHPETSALMLLPFSPDQCPPKITISIIEESLRVITVQAPSFNPYASQIPPGSSSIRNTLLSRCGDICGIVIGRSQTGLNEASALLYELKACQPNQNLIFATYDQKRNRYTFLDATSTELMLEGWLKLNIRGFLEKEHHIDAVQPSSSKLQQPSLGDHPQTYFSHLPPSPPPLPTTPSLGNILGTIVGGGLKRKSSHEEKNEGPPKKRARVETNTEPPTSEAPQPSQLKQ